MILVVDIQGALQNDPLSDMPTDNREASFELLVSSQNEVGWFHLLWGRFSQPWAQIQEDHIDHKEENAGFKSFSTISRNPSVLSMENPQCWSLWYRCGQLRSKTKSKAKTQNHCPRWRPLWTTSAQTNRPEISPTDSLDQGGQPDHSTRKSRSSADKLHDTQQDIRELFIRPAVQATLPCPPAVQSNGQLIPIFRDE